MLELYLKSKILNRELKNQDFTFNIKFLVLGSYI